MVEYSQGLFLYTAAIKIVDALVVLLVWHLCWYLRFDLRLFPVTKGLPDPALYTQVSLLLMVVFCAVFHLVGAYRKDRIHFGFRALKKIVQGSIVGCLVFVSICYFRGTVDYSRLYLAIFMVIVTGALVISRGMMHLVWRRFKALAIKKIRTLLIGYGDLLEMYLGNIRARNPYPLAWVGRLGNPQGSQLLTDIPYLGTEDALLEVLATQRIDQVIVSYPTEFQNQYTELLERLSNELVTVKVIPDHGRYSTFTYSADHECGVPILQFNHSPMGSTNRFLKRLFDILGAFLLLVLLSPLLLVLALLVKFSSNGPVIYSQRRVGADGKEFTCYKFRSMKIDAEMETGPIWARREDPRTTSVGRWLRRTSLDELPQLFNILRGDMSFVGPRPERPNFVSQFKQDIPKYMLRHKMKSGITGWAQVNGLRGNTSLKKRIKYDLYYIGHWSLVFDLKIILMTPLILIRGFTRGHAY